jgi:hypothetical protein
MKHIDQSQCPRLISEITTTIICIAQIVHFWNNDNEVTKSAHLESVEHNVGEA